MVRQEVAVRRLNLHIPGPFYSAAPLHQPDREGIVAGARIGGDKSGMGSKWAEEGMKRGVEV